MSRQASQHRRSGGAARFGAPWGRAVKLTTWGTLTILIAVIVVPEIMPPERSGDWWVRLLPPIIVIIAFGFISLFCVRGFSIKGHELRIQRLLWQTRVPLQDLKGACVDPGAMKSSWRTMGNGGLLVFCGWFRNKKLGNYRAFVTDPARCVVMEFKRRNIVVSPDNPEAFVEALGFEPDSKLNSH